MLEKLPHAIGQVLKGKGPGLDKTVYFDEAFDSVPEAVIVSSAAFADGGTIPARFTEDGEKISPPLAWTGVPAEARGLVLIIEDADSPTPAPIVHALVLDLPPADGGLVENALKSPGGEGDHHLLGKNTFLKKAYLPPDPPPGGGAHRYIFQVYALDQSPGLDEGAGAWGGTRRAQGARARPRLPAWHVRAAVIRFRNSRADGRGTCASTSTRLRPSKSVSSWVCTSVINTRTGQVRSSGQVQRSLRAWGEGAG